MLEAFAPLGAKMRPDMTEHQVDFWGSAIVLALSDLPSFVVISAMAEAMHTAWQFPTEMEAGVRRIAERKVEEHRTAIKRLHAMLKAIHDAGNPPQALLTDELNNGDPMSLEEIRKTPKHLRSLGVSCGAIRVEDLRAVLDEEEAQG